MKKKNFGSLIYTILVYLFLYLPIIVLVVFSFNKSKLNSVWTGFTFKWYQSLFHNAAILTAMRNTLLIGFISTVVSVFIGTITAVGIYKSKFKYKSLFESFLYVPVVIPEIVLGIALLAFFSQVHIPMGLITLIIAHITFSISYVVIVVKARLDGLEPELEEAAMDLGATPRKTFFKVILPIIMPGIAAGALLAFTLSLDDVIISFFVAGPASTTLPLKVFSMVKFGVTPEINALSAIMLIVTVFAVVLSEKLKNSQLCGRKLKILLSSILVIVLTSGVGVYAAEKKLRLTE